jgi:hypothetical protein
MYLTGNAMTREDSRNMSYLYLFRPVATSPNLLRLNILLWSNDETELDDRDSLPDMVVGYYRDPL